MKFKNKKTGEVCTSIAKVYQNFREIKQCTNCNTDCSSCKLSRVNNGKNIGCHIFVYAFPEQAAKMMGYKVINDKLTETIKNDIEQDNEILPPEIQTLQAEIARKEEYINNQRIIIKDYMDIVTILSDELIKISKHQNGEENPEKTVKSVKNEPDQTITLDELLHQTAEEATELAQSALKLLRALKSETPVTKEQALENLTEEVADVKNCMLILEDNGLIERGEVFKIQARKMKRWGNRVKERSGNNERT